MQTQNHVLYGHLNLKCVACGLFAWAEQTQVISGQVICEQCLPTCTFGTVTLTTSARPYWKQIERVVSSITRSEDAGGRYHQGIAIFCGKDITVRCREGQDRWVEV